MKFPLKIILIIFIFTLFTLPGIVLRRNEQFKVIDCKGCSVLRITESVYNNPFTKAGPDKVWEIEAIPKRKEINSHWYMDILSRSDKTLTIYLTGSIYKDMKRIIGPITLEKWGKVTFDDGRTGGGTLWEFLYYDK